MEESTTASHYGAIVTPAFAFGLDMACKNSLWHLDGDKVMWSVGATMSVYNTHSHETRFIPLADRGARAVVLTVAANHKYFAVAERLPGVEHDQVSVYAFGSDKRAKSLPHDPAISRAESARVECLHFSENSKYLLVQYGTPDWTLVVWRWYNGKVLASHRMESKPVLSALFSPVDDCRLAALTPTSLLQYRLDLDREALVGSAMPQTWDAFHMSAMCWIAGSMLAVVGAGGDVMVVHDSQLIMTARAEPPPPPPDIAAAVAAAAARAATAAERRPPAASGSGDDGRGDGSGEGGDGGDGGSGGEGADSTAAPGGAGGAVIPAGLLPEEHLLAVVAKGRGFITAGMSGTVYFFEPPAVEQKKSGVREILVLSRRLSVDLPPPPDLSAGLGLAGRLHHPHPHHHPAHHHHHHHHHLPGGHRQSPVGLPLLPPGISDAAWPIASRPVVLLSVSSGDEEVVAVSLYGDVMVASMPLVLEREEKPIAEVVGPELLEGEPFTRLLGGFLTGRVVGLAAASLQPLIAAASADDRQLRLWNYDARRCVASLTLEDEPLCLDLHPAGGLLLVGYTDKVKMYNVLLDAIDPVFEVGLKRPAVVRFSSGGSRFAAVGRTNAIFLHSTFHGQPQLAVLRAHASQVTDLAFARDDRLMVSVGQGGACYFWDMSTLTRVMDLELVDKQALYLSAVMHTTEHGAVALRTADGRVQQIYNGRVTFELSNCKGGQHSPACLLGADKVLLAADDCGGVVSYAWPADLPPRPGFAALSPQPHPSPLHSALGGGITCMALVGPRGLLFTANGDGTILMSHVNLVLDGTLLEAGAVGGARRPALGHSRLSITRSQRHLPASGVSQVSFSGGPGGGGAVSLSGSAAAAAAAAAGAGAGAGGVLLSSAPFYVTVNEERLVALRDKVLEVAMRVGNAKSDAEYQAFRATQVLREAISQLEEQLAAARAAVAERDKKLQQLQEEGQRHERQIVKELEGAHMSAAEELETLYERRLQVEAEKVRVMAAARDDVRFRGEEELKRLQRAHEKELEDLRSAHELQLARMEARMAEAAAARAEQDRFFNEYVKQAEEDFEDHSERINDKVHSLAEAAEAREHRLKADLNILKRTNLRLKADKSIDMKRMEKLTTDNAVLREQTEDLRLTVAKMQRELAERDAVNADNYVTIQQLRRKVQELEKHKFVLSYKADMYAKNLEPQEKEISRLQDELEGHGRELQGQVARHQQLSRHVAEKDAALRTAKAEVATFKRRCELQEAAITAFAQDLYGAMQQPDDRSVQGKSARQRALDDLVRKYCLGDPRASANRNAAAEAIAAAAAAETRVVLLQWRLDQDARTARATQRTALNQNSQLLRELQVAQQDNRALRDRFDSAVAALRELQHRYNVLERKAGLRSSRLSLSVSTDPLLAGALAGGGGGNGASGGDFLDLDFGLDATTAGGEEDASGDGDGGGGGGGGAAIANGSSGSRLPPSRPASSMGLSPSANAPLRPGTAGPGGRGHHHHHNNNNNHLGAHHRQAANAGGTRPGTAGPVRSSSGWAAHRSVGGAPPQPRGGGTAGGGAVSVAKGAPLKAFADLITVERQRMQSLAAQLQSDAAAAMEQQRTLLGLRDQIVAATAGGEEEDGEGGGGYGSDGSGGDGGREEGADGGTAVTTRGSFGGGSGAGDGEEDSGVVSGSGGEGRQGDGDGPVGRGGSDGLGGGGSSSGGRDNAGASPTYHGPGLRGLHLIGNGGGGVPQRFSSASTTRPLTASFDASRRPATASPSGAGAGSSSSTGAAFGSGSAAPSRVRAAPGGGRLRASSGSPHTLMSSPGAYRPAGRAAASGGPTGPGPASSHPTAGASTGRGGSSPPGGGGGGGGGRHRPTSAAGVGLRAFTDEKVDRFRPPQPSVREDLPL